MKTTIPVYDICKLSGNEREDILISRFGIYLEEHKNLYFPHKHNFYHVVLFTSGGGTHSIDFKTFKVKPYQIYFMVPGQVHTWHFEGDTDGYIINFSNMFFQSFLLRPDYLEQLPFFSGNIDDAVIDLQPEIQNRVVSLFEEIVEENEHTGQMHHDLILALMLQLFVLIARVNASEKKQSLAPYNYTLIKNFQVLVEKNYTLLKLPKEYARLLYITPNHLNALCNDILGIPAGEVIRNRIILEAKRLLINLNLNITEIAGNLNFSDNSYFTKFFKKYTGTTPDEFRKNTLNQNDHGNR